MFYVFLVGLAKLHCGATPPYVMVLYYITNEEGFVICNILVLPVGGWCIHAVSMSIGCNEPTCLAGGWDDNDPGQILL